MFAKIKQLLFPPKNSSALLLFDYDGVIADSYEVYFSTFAEACANLGYARLNSTESFLSLFDGNLAAQLIRAGFPLRKLRALADDFRPQIAAANARIHPFPGMPETLALLSAQFPVIIITANQSETVREFLKRYDLHRVHDVIGSDQETSKVKKIRAARRLFPRHRPFYIGDTKGDMIEARRAGAIPVAVGWGWHDVDRLQSGKAQHIVRTQEELLALFIPPCR